MLLNLKKIAIFLYDKSHKTKKPLRKYKVVFLRKVFNLFKIFSNLFNHLVTALNEI